MLGHVFHSDISCCRNEPDVSPRSQSSAVSEDFAFTRMAEKYVGIDASASGCNTILGSFIIYVEVTRRAS
jgi:hypothetical protein